MLHLIKKINNIEPYKITVLFNTGENITVDLSQKLIEWSQSEDSKFKELLDPVYFMTAKLNAELETVYWENGIDFCPDTLYQWATS
jgi:formyltetrahydrofolate synthetase